MLSVCLIVLCVCVCVSRPSWQGAEWERRLREDMHQRNLDFNVEIFQQTLKKLNTQCEAFPEEKMKEEVLCFGIVLCVMHCHVDVSGAL